MNPRAKEVQILGLYMLKLKFTNGEVKTFDVSALLSYPVYTPLKDATYFQKVFISQGIVQWPGEEDISPDLLYLDSKPTAE